MKSFDNYILKKKFLMNSENKCLQLIAKNITQLNNSSIKITTGKVVVPYCYE